MLASKIFLSISGFVIMEVEENKIKVEHNSYGLLKAKIGFGVP